VENNPKQRNHQKQLGGITGRGFLPSKSGNPNGRLHTRGLVAALHRVYSLTDRHSPPPHRTVPHIYCPRIRSPNVSGKLLDTRERPLRRQPRLLAQQGHSVSIFSKALERFSASAVPNQAMKVEWQPDTPLFDWSPDEPEALLV